MARLSHKRHDSQITTLIQYDTFTGAQKLTARQVKLLHKTKKKYTKKLIKVTKKTKTELLRRKCLLCTKFLPLALHKAGNFTIMLSAINK